MREDCLSCKLSGLCSGHKKVKHLIDDGFFIPDVVRCTQEKREDVGPPSDIALILSTSPISHIIAYVVSDDLTVFQNIPFKLSKRNGPAKQIVAWEEEWVADSYLG